MTSNLKVPFCCNSFGYDSIMTLLHNWLCQISNNWASSSVGYTADTGVALQPPLLTISNLLIKTISESSSQAVHTSIYWCFWYLRLFIPASIGASGIWRANWESASGLTTSLFFSNSLRSWLDEIHLRRLNLDSFLWILAHWSCNSECSSNYCSLN